MAIPIDEGILLSVIAGIFIPILVYLVKMVMKMGAIEGKVDNIIKSREKVDIHISRLEEHESELRLFKLRLENIEKHLNNK